MADDKSKRGGLDRKLVAGKQDYEVRHVAEKAKVVLPVARKAIEDAGPSRKAIEAKLAAKPKPGGAVKKPPAKKPSR
jgi:hypothetical protein